MTFPQPCVEYKDENCVANGWGKDKFGSDGRYFVDILQVFDIWKSICWYHGIWLVFVGILLVFGWTLVSICWYLVDL